jgi:hypothetical protein
LALHLEKMQNQNDQTVAQLSPLASAHAVKLLRKVFPIESFEVARTEMARLLFEPAQVIGVIACGFGHERCLMLAIPTLGYADVGISVIQKKKKAGVRS